MKKKSKTYEGKSNSEQFVTSQNENVGVLGSKAVDRVYIGTITLPSQEFGQIHDFSEDLTTSGVFEGVLGLAIHNHPKDTPTILEKLVPLLKNPVFSLYLNDQVNGATKRRNDVTAHHHIGTSQLILGGVNQNLYSGCLSWQSLRPVGFNGRYAGISIEKLNYEGKPSEKKLNAIISSNSENIVGPRYIIGSFAKANSAQCFQADKFGEIMGKIDCSDPNTLFDFATIDCNGDFKPLAFTIGEREYFLGFHDLVKKESDGHYTYCILRVTPTNKQGYFILGVPFINKYYTAFDAKLLKVGFAPVGIRAEVCAEDSNYDISAYIDPIDAYSASYINDEFVPKIDPKMTASILGHSDENTVVNQLEMIKPLVVLATFLIVFVISYKLVKKRHSAYFQMTETVRKKLPNDASASIRDGKA